MKSQYTYQHYIPQCYLRNFSNNKDKNAFVFVYNKLQSKVYPKAIKDICGEDDLYTISQEFCAANSEDIDTSSKVIEREFFSFEVEKKYSSILNDSITNILQNGSFDKEKKYELAYHIAIQFLRLPDIKKKDAEMAYSIIPEMIELHKEGLFLETGDIAFKDIDVKFNIDESINHFNSSYGSEETTTFFAKCLANNYWNFLVVDDSKAFYTSDFPVVVMPHVPNATPKCLGLTQYGAEMSFPISKNIMLVVWDRIYFTSKSNSDCSVIIPDDKQFRRYNLFRYYYAKRHVISFDNSFDMIDFSFKINNNKHIFYDFYNSNNNGFLFYKQN